MLVHDVYRDAAAAAGTFTVAASVTATPKRLRKPALSSSDFVG